MLIGWLIKSVLYTDPRYFERYQLIRPQNLLPSHCLIQWNARSFSGWRLHDFDIGLTCVSPSVRAPSPGSYEVCHHFEGLFQSRFQSSGTITCDQVTRGRYLVIQIPGPSELLQFCELQVSGTYGECHRRGNKVWRHLFGIILTLQ